MSDNPFLKHSIPSSGDDGVENDGSMPSAEHDALIASRFMQIYHAMSDKQKNEILSGVKFDDDSDHDPVYNHETSVPAVEDHGEPDGTDDGESPEPDDDIDEDESEDDTDDDEPDDEYATFDEMEDEVLADNGDSGAVKLTDSIITYETRRYINPKTDKPYSRMRLRKEPPVLEFRQHRRGTTEDEDEMVNIIITRSVAAQLNVLMGNILKAYDGIPIEDSKKEPFSIRNLKKNMANAWRYEPAKVVIAGIIIVVFLVLGVYGMIQGMR